MSVANLYQQPLVRNVLNRCRRQIRRHAFLTGTASVLACIVCCVLVAILLDYWFALSAVVRLGLLICSIVASLFVGWKFLLRPLSRSLSDRELGAAVDLSYPELREGLATLVSVQQPTASASEAGSELMRKKLEQQVNGQLQSVNHRQFVNSVATQKRCGLATLSLIFAGSLVTLWPGISQLLVRRFVTPFANLAAASNLYFDIENGDRTVARSTNVQIFAIPKWRHGATQPRPKNVTLRLIADNGVTDSVPMLYDDSRGGYTASIEQISNSLNYELVCTETRSRSYRLSVVDAPVLTSAVLTADPPAYVGGPIERFDGMLGEMSVFERSRLQLNFEFNKPVSAAELVWSQRDPLPESETAKLNRRFDHLTGEEVIDDPEQQDPDARLFQSSDLASVIAIPLSKDGTSGSLIMEADVGGEFEIRLIDQHELSNPIEPFRRLTVVYDQPPQLTTKGLNRSDKFRPDDIIPVDAFVSDDIGIGDVELHYFVNDGVTQIVSATDYDRGTRQLNHEFRLALQDLNITDGDRISLKVRVTDERPIPAPHEVWSEEAIVSIDNDAKAPGTRELEKRNEQMIGALKALQQELAKDRRETEKLRNESRRKWDADQQQDTKKLSEKQQQQGQLMNAIASEAATHPLMKNTAEQIAKLGEELKSEVPLTLEQAAEQQRKHVAKTLQTAEKQLESIRRKLGQQIQQLEQAAQLESDLAELNRLALAAERVASQSQQLQQDKTVETPAEGVSQSDWQRQLNEREADLREDQSELSEDLKDLLANQDKLREAAQRSQAEQLAQLSEQALKLANQQQRLAEGIQDEAKEVSAEAGQLVRDIKQVKREADQLNQDLQSQDSQPTPPDTTALQQAAEELSRGNLAAPEQKLSDTATAFDKLAENLKSQEKIDPAADDSTAQTRSSREGQIQQASRVGERLRKLKDRLNQLKQKRQTAQDAIDSSNEKSTNDHPQEPSRDNAKNLNAQSDLANDKADKKRLAAQQAAATLQQQMNQLVKTSRQIQSQIESESNKPAQQAAQKTADRTETASQQANAGRFQAAASEFRRAAAFARQAELAVNKQKQGRDSQATAEQTEQLQRFEQDLRDMSDVLRQMSQDDLAQAASQQQAQQQVTEQAARLPQRLAQMQQRMQLDALQMQPQAQQAQQAVQSANAARQSTQQASQQLNQQQLQQAQQSGQQASRQLREVANAAQRTQQQLPQPPSDSNQPQIPNSVGENVAEALENLQQAAEAMQPDGSPNSSPNGDQSKDGHTEQSGQSSSQDSAGESSTAPQNGPTSNQRSVEQQSSGQQANGQQAGGESSAADRLKDAADALAQAAKNSLPGQLTPGNPADGDSTEGVGSWQLFNGLLAPATNSTTGSRNWGQLNDELNTETGKAASSQFDSEYQNLIRMYFSELAKVNSKSASNDGE